MSEPTPRNLGTRPADAALPPDLRDGVGAGYFAGINHFADPTLNRLRFAVNDAIDFAHAFVITLLLVDPAQTFLAIDEGPADDDRRRKLEELLAAGVRREVPTRSNMLRRIADVTRLRVERLFITVSSHGFGRSIMPADGYADPPYLLDQTGIPGDFLDARLSSSPAKLQLVYYDACRKDPHVFDPRKKETPIASLSELIKPHEGLAIIRSCDNHQVSYEFEEFGNGLSAHYLLRALKLKTRPQHDPVAESAEPLSDGRITLEIAMKYAAVSAAACLSQAAFLSEADRSACRQHPCLEAPEHLRQLPLALDPDLAARLRQQREQATARREHLLRAIEARVGLGENKLRTDEAEFCLELLGRPARTKAEQELVADIQQLADGSMAVPLFSRLLRAARMASEAKPPVAVTPAPPPVSHPAPAPPPSFDAVVARLVKSLKLQIDIDGPFTWDAYLQLARRLQSLDGKDPTAHDLMADAAAFAEGRLPAAAFLGRIHIGAPLRPTSAADINSVGIKFVRIEPGTFVMGSPKRELERSGDEEQHEATLSRAFYMAATTVSQAQWKAVMGQGNNPSLFKGSVLPVENVSWYDAVEFCEQMSKLEGLTWRLPTEAEWEYCCRAGTETAFNTGGTISTDQANYNGETAYNQGRIGEYRQKTLPVEHFQPNAWGLFQMHGNVWEWCNDIYAEYSGHALVPAPATAGVRRALRGGSWDSVPSSCRCAFRYDVPPDLRLSGFGFRVVLDST